VPTPPDRFEAPSVARPPAEIAKSQPAHFQRLTRLCPAVFLRACRVTREATTPCEDEMAPQFTILRAAVGAGGDWPSIVGTAPNPMVGFMERGYQARWPPVNLCDCKSFELSDTTSSGIRSPGPRGLGRRPMMTYRRVGPVSLTEQAYLSSPPWSAGLDFALRVAVRLCARGAQDAHAWHPWTGFGACRDSRRRTGPRRRLAPAGSGMLISAALDFDVAESHSPAVILLAVHLVEDSCP
jgi:hypothetical protein